MSLAKKVAHNTIIQIAGKAVSTVLGLLALAFITRYLGRTGFGEYTTVLTFLTFFAVIADFGLTLVTVQMISVRGADENKILNNIFGLRLASIIIVLLLAPLTVSLFPYSAAITPSFSACCTSISFSISSCRMPNRKLCAWSGEGSGCPSV